MDLETLKLVAFAVLTEDGAGIMAVGPNYLRAQWAELDKATSEAEASAWLAGVDGDLWKLNNYLGIWDQEPEPEPPEPKPSSEAGSQPETRAEKIERTFGASLMPPAAPSTETPAPPKRRKPK